MENENAPMDIDETHLKGTVYDLDSHWWTDDEKPLSLREFLIYLPICVLLLAPFVYILSTITGANLSTLEVFGFSTITCLFSWVSTFFLTDEELTSIEN